MRRTSPRHEISKGRKRWGDGVKNLHRELRRLYLASGSYQKCADALGVSVTPVQRVLGGGVDISEDLASKLATKLGTTPDAIATGAWAPKGRAA